MQWQRAFAPTFACYVQKLAVLSLVDALYTRLKSLKSTDTQLCRSNSQCLDSMYISHTGTKSTFKSHELRKGPLGTRHACCHADNNGRLW